VGPDHLHRGRHIAGLGDHLEPFVGIDQHPQAAAHDRVVVGDHKSDLLHQRATLARSGAGEALALPREPSWLRPGFG
jgi:hypothetical protein